jgi:hypothetical protein
MGQAFTRVQQIERSAVTVSNEFLLSNNQKSTNLKKIRTSK